MGHQQGTALAASGTGLGSAEHRETRHAHDHATQVGDAYEGLLKKKDEYLGVVVKWK